MTEKLAKVFNIIVDDKFFIQRVKQGIDNIMKDGKVDYTDIPEIIFIITETFNSLGSFKLSEPELLSLFEMLYNYINDTYKLIPEEKQKEFKSLVDSSLKLVMFKPQLKQLCINCFN
jgi:hypothetical protein